MQGPATPDHVLRTKRVPLAGRDVAAYVAAYREYFGEHAPAAREPKTMLDPAPRVILDARLGMCTLGRSARDRRCAQRSRVLRCDDIIQGFAKVPGRPVCGASQLDQP